MQDYLKDCYYLKHRKQIDPDKVKYWCLRWNCKHLRDMFKKRKNRRAKNKIIIEIKTEIRFSINEKSKNS